MKLKSGHFFGSFMYCVPFPIIIKLLTWPKPFHFWRFKNEQSMYEKRREESRENLGNFCAAL